MGIEQNNIVAVTDFNSFKNKVDAALEKAGKSFAWSESIQSDTLAKASSLSIIFDQLDEAKKTVESTCSHNSTIKTSHNSHNSHNSPVYRYYCNGTRYG